MSNWVCWASITQEHDFCSETIIIDEEYFNTEQECIDWIEERESKCTDKNIRFNYETVEE